jgi:hypothetical protein
MPLTYEQRVELLKKAREAKKNKKMAKETPPAEAEPETEPVIQTEETSKKTRTKKAKPETKTLDIKPDPMPEFVDSDPEIEEQIIYKPKDKKKKKIVRKIIMEQSSDEEEVEVVEEVVKAPKKVKDHAPERAKVPETPKYVCPSKTSFFNF